MYIAHLFEEDQVILTSKWRDQRVQINGPWKNLKIYRLGDVDLFLSKLMRNDAQDIADADFVLDQAGWNQNDIRQISVWHVCQISQKFANSLFSARLNF